MLRAGIALLLGCVLAMQLPAPLPAPRWWVVLPLLLFFSSRLRLVALFLLGLALFNLQASQWLAQRLEGGRMERVIVGEVIGLPHKDAHRVRFNFRPRPAPGLPHEIRLSWYYPPQIPAAGEKWRLRVRLKPPHGFANPAGFDYERWLMRQGIGATGYVRKDSRNRRLSASPYEVSGLRQQLAERLDEILDGHPAKGLVMGLALGVREEITPQQWETLLATGTNHLLAISGLHVGLVAALGFWLGRWLWLRLPRAALVFPADLAAVPIGLLAAAAYALMAGFSVPTQRALLMTAVVMLLILRRQRLEGKSVLGLALLGVLLLNPFSVLDAGFWLSFFAVAVILFVVAGGRRTGSATAELARLQVVLSVLLLSLTVYWFGRAVLTGIPANLVAVPVVSLAVVPLVLLGTIASLLFDPLGQWLLWLAAELLLALMAVLDGFSSLGGTLFLPQPPLLAVMFGIVGGLWLFAPSGLPGRWLGLVLFLPLMLPPLDRPPGQMARVTLLDVGQGMAVVVETARHVLVYDTGPAFPSGFNTAEAVVLPYLHSQGWPSIDGLILSNGDNDHSGGVQALLRQISAKRVMSGDPGAFDDLAVAPCRVGEVWQWDGVEFVVLHPGDEEWPQANNRSCVLRITAGGQRLLLAGDIEREAENALLSRGADVGADIITVPHHGSRTSSTSDFLDAVAPQWALVSAGYLNRYGFPKSEVTSRYRRRGIRLLNTAECGAVSLRLGDVEPVAPSCLRRDEPRLWRYPPGR